jgi:ribosomal protein S27E
MKDEPKKDPPIEEANWLVGMTVVDFGDIRVARGLSRRPFSSCRHERLVYDNNERRVWCKDCERDIEGFDAFKLLVDQFAAATDHAERRLRKVEEDEKRVVRTRAGKHLDALFQKKRTVPACPHCGTGIFPEDALLMQEIGRDYAQRQPTRKTPRPE